MTATKYQRVLLKLSGETFSRGEDYSTDVSTLDKVVKEVKRVMEMGVEIALVVGGGNLWRGAKAEQEGMDRVTADYAGMLATVINALVLQDRLKKEGIIARTQSAITIQHLVEPYSRDRAVHHLKKGRAVIFAGGTGNPYLTTDTAAALRATEIGAEVLLMTKNNVDGIYSADPLKDPQAQRFDRLTYLEALNRRLGVMDAAALLLCLENNLPIIVFDLQAPRSIERVVMGEAIGTIVSDEKENG